MGPRAMIYIQSFMKISSGIQKLIRGMHKHRQHGDSISQLLFFLIKKVRRNYLKNVKNFVI
jgi:hypothetical protein